MVHRLIIVRLHATRALVKASASNASPNGVGSSASRTATTDATVASCFALGGAPLVALALVSAFFLALGLALALAVSLPLPLPSALPLPFGLGAKVGAAATSMSESESINDSGTGESGASAAPPRRTRRKDMVTMGGCVRGCVWGEERRVC